MARKSGGILAAIGEGLSLGGKKYEEYLEKKKKEEKAETLKDSIREIIGYKTSGSIDPQNLRAGITADDPVGLIAGMVDSETGDLSNFGQMMLKAQIDNQRQEKMYQRQKDLYAMQNQPDYGQLLDQENSKDPFRNFKALYGIEKLSPQAERQIIMDIIQGKNPLMHKPVYAGRTRGFLGSNFKTLGAKDIYDLQ